MLITDSDSLICDLAQTYHLYDMRSIPPKTVAVLSCGLGDESRIKMKLSGQKVPLTTILLARCVDTLSMLLWTKCKPGTKKPDSIATMLTDPEEKPDEAMIFVSSDDFDAARLQIMNGG